MISHPNRSKKQLLPIHTKNFFEKRAGEIIGYASNAEEAAQIAREWGARIGNRGNGHYENIVRGVELLKDDEGRWYKVERHTSPSFT